MLCWCRIQTLKNLFKVSDMVRAINVLNEAPTELPGEKYGHHLQEPGMLPQVLAHVRCPCYLVDNIWNRISHDGAQLRLKKCNDDNGSWQDEYRICTQKSGLFILFGYTGPSRTNGHFVAPKADEDKSLDCLNGLQYNILLTSIRTIFPGGLDCGPSTFSGSKEQLF